MMLTRWRLFQEVDKRRETGFGRILRFSTWAAVFLVICGHDVTKIGGLNRWWRERIGNCNSQSERSRLLSQ